MYNLYIKQHLITGMKYFGFTMRDNVDKYTGSGKHWTNHLKKHGKNYNTTLWFWEFDNQEECTRFALEFSEYNNIVESKEWANEVSEDGKNGGHFGSKTGPRSEETKRKISISNTGKKHSEETRKKLSISQQARSAAGLLWQQTAEGKVALSIWKPDRVGGRKGKTNTLESNKARSEKMKGRKITDKQKEQISIANSGRVRTKETLIRMSEVQKGKKHSEETKKKMSDSHKKRKLL